MHEIVRRQAVAILLCAVGLGAAPAEAQSLGAQVGASAGPDQFYFGGHLETPRIVDRVHFRPNVEVGVGEDHTLTGLNFELLYRFLGDYSWKLIAGGGPALNVISGPGDARSEGGFNFIVGVAHDEGLFIEIKGGALDSPNFKLGVGYVFRRR